MDEKSLEILEFPRIRKILAGYTSFSASQELALGLEPLTDFEGVSLRLRQSAEARYLLSIKPDVSISGASDIREAVRMAAVGKILEPQVLLEVQQTLAVMRQVRGSLHEVSNEVPLLRDIAGVMVELPVVEKEIDRCLSPDGEVLDRASPALSAVRIQLREARQRLRDRLEEMMRTPRGQRIIQEPLITERGGRYVIPVKTEFRKDIKGITHDTSNTGATVFVEPWTTIEMGNTVRELVSEEKREVERILRDLSAAVGSYKEELLPAIARLAELDLALAKARYARAARANEAIPVDYSGTPEKGKEDAFIRLVDARHPLLGQKAVPLSVEIGSDFSILVITGPNTGGKTVALKTIGLMSIMTQAGMPIPASAGTRIPVFDGIFADIGDEQSIEQTLSSFSWHISNIVRIIRNATARSLVLLDELGTSTDPAEGSALARSILLHFLSSKTLAVATTHYGELKAFAHTTPGLQNAAFEFDPATLSPTYHMTTGIPGGSNALATAERLGVPPPVIEKARTMLSGGELALDAMLADIMSEKKRTEDVRKLLEKEREEVELRNAEMEGRLAALNSEERRVIREARDNIVREAAVLHGEIRQASADLRKKRSKEAVDAAKKALAEAQARLRSGVWTPVTEDTGADRSISAGDTVYLKDVDLHAKVLSISEKTGEAEVQAGQFRLRVSMNGMEKITPGTVENAAAPGRVVMPPARVMSTKLDLRGKRADAVEVELDSYLNNAILANLREVVIIHGYGTGTVRQIVRDFLAVHPLVASFRSGKQGEGGDGTTIVSL